MEGLRTRYAIAAFVLALAPTVVAGCGDLKERSEDRAAGAGEISTRVQPSTRTCGSDRYNGVQGVDVSKWQGTFDWSKYSSQGVKFGFARVSDGTQYIDATFSRNWKQMKKHGVIPGAYQFFRPNLSAKKQANIVVNKVGKLGPGELPCVLDLERTGGESPATIANKMETWMSIVEQGTGKKPIIYTSPSFWESNVHDSSFADHPLWVAHWGTDCPSIPNTWDDWTFWQYCNGKQKYCKNGEGFDRNVFNGSMKDLQKFAGGSGSTGPKWKAEYVQQSFPLSSTALEMEPGETVSGFIEMKNAGGETWNSKTYLATTEPRDRTSKFAASDWEEPDRPAVVSGEVKTGESYKFEFTLEAPSTPGTYTENFGLVQEGVAWFADKGGPPDSQLEVKVEVKQPPMMQDPDTGTTRRDTGYPEPDVGVRRDTTGQIGPPPKYDGGGFGGVDAGGTAGQPLGSLVTRSNSTQSGCSQAPSSAPASLLFAGLSVFAFGLLRRRRRATSGR